MDDMKKLVEKYKQELMEYSRTAHPAPQKLEFPEMIDEPAPEIPSWDTIPPFPETEEDSDELSNSPEWSGRSGRSGMDYTEPADSSPEPISERSDYNEAEEAPQMPTNGETERKPQIIGYMDENHAEIPENLPIEALEEILNEQSDSGYNSQTTPETAENLVNQPESGQREDEQLAKREFESSEELGDSAQNETEPPYKSREDVQQLEQTRTARQPAPERQYSSYREFVDETPRRGTLQFVVSTAREALPVPGARCEVSKVIGGEKHIFYTLVTDISGQTEVVSLPALSSALSQTPEGNIQPYILYDALVTKPGFNDVVITNLPIFEGIKSIQRVNLVPFPQGEMPQTEQITESEPDLTEVRDAAD